jgi:ATP-dependent helicase/nuclease subunit A
VLFRKFTNAQVYLEALQRHGIPYMTDGERHFYRRQEVIDMINVLRVLDDPTDAIALVGILRSSLGGLTDQEIMDVARLGPLDIRRSRMLEAWESSSRPVIQELWQRLSLLHTYANRLPIAELLDQLFIQLPMVELAAASSQGEQAVVNLWKLRDLMIEQSAVPHLSFSAWVDRLVESLMSSPSEPEAPLAEDTLEAVRVLTVHKGKGLEFPVVVLPGLHQKAAGPDRGADITYDWISGLYGCTLPSVWNAGQVPLWEKQRIREEAEQRRVLYVGMTRARDRLVLSGGLLPKRGGGTLLGLLQQIAEDEFGNSEQATVRVGPVTIPQTVVSAGRLKSLKSPPPSLEIEAAHSVIVPSSQWHERETRCKQTNQAVAFVTPSYLHQEKSVQGRGEGRQILQGDSQRLGTLMHRLLQGWDFRWNPGNLRSPLSDFCQRHLSCESEGDVGELSGELETLLDHFLHSAAYRELQQSIIMGREVPFTVPRAIRQTQHFIPQNCVMEGVMDVVYEIDGEVWVGDYKTDQVTSSTLAERVEIYRGQAHAYAMAARQCLGTAVKGCKLFFIRLGEIVRVEL